MKLGSSAIKILSLFVLFLSCAISTKSFSQVFNTPVSTVYVTQNVNMILANSQMDTAWFIQYPGGRTVYSLNVVVGTLTNGAVPIEAHATWVINYNAVTDVTGLAGLSSLVDLGLEDNNISDVSPLATLTSLTKLELTSNNISDVSPLSKLIMLDYLGLAINNISDVSPLTALTGLDELWLAKNPIDCVSQAASLETFKANGTNTFKLCI